MSAEQLNSILGEVVSRLSGQNSAGDICKKSDGKNSGNNTNSASNTTNTAGGQSSILSLTPSQALVIAGIVGGVINVDSVLVDKNQTVQIILTGSLKRKTPLDRMVSQLGSMRFDDVLRAIIENFGLQ